MEHTKGPWHALTHDSDDKFAISNSVLSDWANPQHYVAIVDNKANARLIAAAPDMLEALEACIKELQPYHVDYKMDGPISNLIAQCKQAIAKARA